MISSFVKKKKASTNSQVPMKTIFVCVCVYVCVCVCVFSIGVDFCKNTMYKYTWTCKAR